MSLLYNKHKRHCPKKDALERQIIELEKRISALELKIANLEGQIAALQRPYIPPCPINPPIPPYPINDDPLRHPYPPNIIWCSAETHKERNEK